MALIPLPPGGKPWQGIDLLHDPREIAPDNLALSQNLLPVQPGVLSKRGAQLDAQDPGLIGVTSGTFGLPVKVLPMGSYGTRSYVLATKISPNRAPGTPGNLRFTMVGMAGAINVLDKLGLAAQLTAPTFYPAMVAYNRTAIISFGPPGDRSFSFNGSALGPFAGVQLGVLGDIFAPGGNPSLWNFLTAQGVQLTCSVAGVTPPRVMGHYSDRLVYANFGPGFGSYLLFSDSSTPGRSGVTPATNIPFTVASSGAGLLSRAIPIGDSRDADDIIAVQEIFLTAIGSVPQRALLVLKERSAYVITGEPNQCTDNQTTTPFLGTMVVSQVSFDCGCASAETVVKTPYGIIWAGADDVWLFHTGQIPVRIGSKIRPALLRTASQFRYRWHAAYFNGFYRLAIDSAGAGLNDDAPCGEQYWLDLRAGAPQGGVGIDPASTAQWWGPMQFYDALNSAPNAPVYGTRTFVQLKDAQNADALFGIEEAAAADNSIQARRVQYDVPNRRDMASDPSQTFEANNSGAEIVADFRTKEYDGDDATIDKIIAGLQLNLWTDIDAILNCDIIMDGGQNVDTQLKGIGSLGFTLDVDTFDALAGRKTQGVQIFANPNGRDVAKTYQFRLYDIPGYFVVAGVNDTIPFVWHKLTGGGFKLAYLATVPAGYYTNITALTQAIASAMQSVSSHSFSGAVIADVPSITETDGGGQSWWPMFSDADGATATNYVAGTVTPAQFRACKKLLALLAFNTSVAGSTLEGTTVSGTGAVFRVTVPVWEFVKFVANLTSIARRPT